MDYPYYVTASDNFLTGFGSAKNRISKLVVKCETFEEAKHIEKKLNSIEDMVLVSIQSTYPKYDHKRYKTDYITKLEKPHWYKLS